MITYTELLDEISEKGYDYEVRDTTHDKSQITVSRGGTLVDVETLERDESGRLRLDRLQRFVDQLG